MVQDSGFRVSGVGSRVYGAELRLGLRVHPELAAMALPTSGLIDDT